MTTEIEIRISRLEKCYEDTSKQIKDMREESIESNTEIKQGIVYIKGAMDDLKKCNDTLNTCVNALTIDLARHPSSKEVKTAIDDVKTHKTYFALIGAALLIIFGWLSRWNPFG